MAWVDTNTGESLNLKPQDAGPEWVYVEIPDEISDDYVTTVYLERKVELQAKVKALMVQHEKRLKDLHQKIKGLDFMCLGRLEVQARRDIEGGKKKSVHYEYATVGFRKKQRIEVLDEEAAMNWAREHHKDALKIELKESFLKSQLPKDKLKKNEIPGVKHTVSEDFYVKLPN